MRSRVVCGVCRAVWVTALVGSGSAWMAGSLLGLGLGLALGIGLDGGVAAPVVGCVQKLALRLGEGEERACSGAGGVRP